MISLNRNTISGPVGASTQPDEDNFSAIFPSGPLFRPSVAQPVVFAPDFGTPLSGPTSARFVSSAFLLNIRQCAIPGYAHLSAGAIQIQPPNGDPVTVNPNTINDGVTMGSNWPRDSSARARIRFWGAPGAAYR
jgi:hypothetical protein